MSEVTTRFLNLPVYTSKGKYVGQIGNVILDLETRMAASLLITNTNAAVVDGGRNVAVPYRWVSAVGDIVIVNNFPDRVEIAAATGDAVEEKIEREIAA